MISGRDGSHVDTQQTLHVEAAPEFIPLEGTDSVSHHQHMPHRYCRRPGVEPNRFLQWPAGPVALATNGRLSHSRTKRKRESQADGAIPFNVAWPIVGQVADSENVPPVAENSDRSQGYNESHPQVEDCQGVWNSNRRAYRSNVLGLHEEIEDFFQWMMPTKMEHDARVGVVARIQSLVCKLWPDTKVDIFGSFKTGLYLPTSDIDLVVSGKWPKPPLHVLAEELESSGIPRLKSLLLLDKAAVPIVKMTDDKTGIKVDISFNTVNGIRAAELIKFYKKTYPPLAKLIYVLKQFLLQRSLNEVFMGGLSSYALILMAVSFLQLHPRPDVKQHNTNLGVLLIEFFELYGRNFNYAQSAIRLRDGGCYLPREQMMGQMPHLANQSTGVTLCIEDPLDASNDVGKGSYYFQRVKESFENAYVILTKLCSGTIEPENTNSILSQIVSVSEDVKEFRRQFVQTTIVPTGHANESEDQFINNNGSDVPLTPIYPPPSPSSNVTPHDLPDRHFHPKEINGSKDHFKVPENPHPPPAKEEEVDNMSGVSTLASSCCDSDGSPCTGPNSEMSISPDHSEADTKSTRRLLNVGKRLSPKKRPDRADLDPDWRSGGGGVSPESSDGGFKENESAFKLKDNRRRKESGDTNSSGSNSPPRQQHRADQDPDWRNHRSPSPASESAHGQWRVVNRSGARHQYCAPGEKSSGVTGGKEKRPPGFAATAVQMAPPSPTPVVPEENGNRLQSNSNLELLANENFVKKSQRKTKKMKKVKKNEHRSAENDNNQNNSDSDFSVGTTTTGVRRFSCVQGQAKAKS